MAGVKTRPTGFCLLKGKAVEADLFYTDKEIIERTLQSTPKLVAIDAPLYLPPGRTSLEDRTGPHLRESDRELLKIGIKIFPATWVQCAN